MSGLIVVGCTVAGGVLGGGLGFAAGLARGSMELWDLTPLAWTMTGVVAGGLIGAFAGGQIT